MAAGLVYHNIVTKTGVDFTIAGWAPDTALPDANILPSSLLIDIAGAEVLGQVTASPAATTVLGRLKTIADGITTLDGRVDGLEALLTTQAGYLDGLETLSTAANALLTTQAGYLDGIEANQATQTTALQLIDDLAAALNAQSALRVQIEQPDGTDVEAVIGIADDAPDSGNSVAVGGIAKGALSGETLVAAGDRLRMRFGLDGALITRNVPLPDIVSGNASNTDGTLTEVIAAAAAGIKQYLTRISLSNAHASTVAIVEIKSGTVVKYTVAVPPGGREISFDPPLPPNAAAEAWNFDPGAAVTTLYCAMVGFKSKV